MKRLVAWMTLAALLAVFAAGILSLYRSRHRGLDIDEVESLQAAWLMKGGKRLYIDFLEDHSPYLFLIFQSMLPMDPLPYAARARLFCGAAGVLAVACAAVIAFRITRKLMASVIVAAVLFGSFPVWARAMAEARHDPPALLLFWLGALLILDALSRRRSPAAASAGLGLMVIAALLNPKWPLTSAAFFVVFVWIVIRDRRIIAALWPATLLISAGMAVILQATTVRNYLFFVFEYNQAMARWFSHSKNTAWLDPAGTRPFAWCGDPFRGFYPLIAAILLLVCFFARSRLRDVDLQALGVIAAAIVASLVEIRWIDPYPNLRMQYYLMWSFGLAILYGCLVSTLLTLIERIPAASLIALSTLAVVITLYGSAIARPSASADDYWFAASYIRSRLRPGETVWLANFRRPIAVPEASYYWFAIGDLVPFNIRYLEEHPRQTMLPPLSEEDLPICRAANGLETTARFVSGGMYLQNLPKTRECLQRLIAGGRARPTAIPLVYDLAR